MVSLDRMLIMSPSGDVEKGTYDIIQTGLGDLFGWLVFCFLFWTG